MHNDLVGSERVSIASDSAAGVNCSSHGRDDSRTHGFRVSDSLAPGAHHLVETERLAKQGRLAIYIKLDVANAVSEFDEEDNLTSVQLPYSQ